MPWGGSAESISDPGRSKERLGRQLWAPGELYRADNEGILDVSPVPTKIIGTFRREASLYSKYRNTTWRTLINYFSRIICIVFRYYPLTYFPQKLKVSLCTNQC